ncbi:dolichyl-phosphate mannose synthase [Clostridium butyricum]|uniref:dolichyl-phosphate mannose synthase n=1 Tax=Clostridium butyricum TaxID=1492 RepID=UPI001FACF558|nr:dolichyl-phosphate mannose synthase [Clostridium butyricum]MCQ2016307.1 dolichyl-phosphate mannose synthase [Clostridium butyricum]MCQ2023375.1 dolichyl-phosphate mannose synthase [Clostridium butyricum]
MMNKKGINLIMPMAGRGSRFTKEGFEVPKPLIKINNKPFFYWATQSIRKFIELNSLTFVVLREHVEKFSIDKHILDYFPEAKVEIIPEVLNGAVLTCIEGIRNINNNNPIIFNDCDHLFSSSLFNIYCNREIFSEIDGALLTFKSDDSKFSYLQCDNYGNVIKTIEKKVVSNDAICGAYYFRNKDIFLECTNKYLEICNYSEYFVSGVYNVMAEKGYIIKNFEVDFHLPFGTPVEYELAVNSDKFEELI